MLHESDVPPAQIGYNIAVAWIKSCLIWYSDGLQEDQNLSSQTLGKKGVPVKMTFVNAIFGAVTSCPKWHEKSMCRRIVTYINAAGYEYNLKPFLECTSTRKKE